MSMEVVINESSKTNVLDRVEAGGGLATVTLGDLKEVVGVRRLGKFVLSDIKDWLRREGLNYFPLAILDENPVPRQEQELRIYKSDRMSPIFRAVDAVLDPSAKGDEFIRSLAGEASTQQLGDLQARIERAREALEEAQSYLSPETVQ
jgi:hypothetical protein